MQINSTKKTGTCTYEDICIFVQEFQEFFKAPETAFETPEKTNIYTINYPEIVKNIMLSFILN